MTVDLPDSVRIVEVAPRDGFQNTRAFIPTGRKVHIIENLLEAGLKEMQIGSFVSARAIPQMKDANDVVTTILSRHDADGLSVLVPNMNGARRAADAGIGEITYVISVTEPHNRANVKRGVAESFDELRGIIASPEFRFRRIKLDLATAFGCPFEGRTPQSLVLERVAAAREMGIRDICLCDTIGTATPKQTRDLLELLGGSCPEVTFRAHFHDTRGAGIANSLTAIDAGVRIIETSAAGIGGCPFAPGAAGNTATEDLVFVLDAMGVNTGIDLSKLIRAAKDLVRQIEDPGASGHLIHLDDDKLFPPGLYRAAGR